MKKKFYNNNLNSDLSIVNKVETNKVKTTNINVLLNRVKLDKKKEFKKKFFTSIILFLMLGLVTFFFINN